MSLYAELKRRNVFRVGVFYLVSSWLILQVADVLFGVLRLPDWTLSFVAALLALGFLPALVFAWIYELTPEGIKKESEIDRSRSIAPNTGKRLDRMIIFGLAAVIVALLVERFWGQADAPTAAPEPVVSQAQQETSASQASESSDPSDLSVGVLPFANMSSDAENEYFADGLTEELLNALAQVEALKVAGRTSSFYFKGRNEDLRSIGQQLGVAHVVEGSVRKAGNRVRITAQLVKVDDGFHLWSETYDRDLADIFQVQENISRSIADALKLKLGIDAAQTSPLTSDLSAYEKYLEARTLISQREQIQRAIDLLHEAVVIDPEFAEAWASLGQAWSLGPYYGVGDFESVRPEIEAAAERALTIDPDQSVALTALANLLRDRGDFLEAEDLYLAALRANSEEVDANSQYAQLLMRVGHFRRALPYSRKAREVDPLAAIQNTLYGWNLVLVGELEEALVPIERALELAPDYDYALLNRFRLMMRLGRLYEAESSMAARFRSHGGSEVLIEIMRKAMEQTRRGDSEAAGALLRQALATAAEEPIGQRWNFADNIAILAQANDHGELAEELFNRLPGGSLVTVEDIEWQTEDWWKDALRDSGVTTYWRERGWPEHCQPVGDDDFECR